MEVVGTDAELNLEKLLALDPDLVIGFGTEDGTAWRWWDEKITEEATAVAPFVGMKFSGRPVVEVIEDYASLAEALGGDADTPEVAEARAAFDERLDTLRAIAAEKPLTILPLNGAEELWVGQRTLGQLALLEELGFTIGGPQDEEAWAELSWERVPDHPADVVLSYTGSDEAMAANPVYAGLPAVQAGRSWAGTTSARSRGRATSSGSTSSSRCSTAPRSSRDRPRPDRPTSRGRRSRGT